MDRVKAKKGDNSNMVIQFLSMSESDFPALGQRKAETFAPLSRAPNSPSQPSRPHSMSEHNQGPGVLEVSSELYFKFL